MGGAGTPLSALHSAAKANPHDAGAWLDLAEALQEHGEASKALLALRHAHALAAQETLHLLRAGRLYLRQGALTDALNAARRALHLDPELLPAALATGEYLLRLEDHDAAALSLSVAELRHPESAEVQLLLGRACLAGARWRDALRHLERALTLGGAPADAFRLMAQAHSALGRVEDEIRDLQQVRLHDARDLDSAVALGERLALQGRRQEAAAILTELAEHPPHDADAMVRLGHALVETLLLVPAVRLLREAIRINPDLADAHFELGSALQAAGALKEAVHSFQAAVALRPEDPELGYRLGVSLRELGRLREASAALIRAAAAAPDDARIEAALAETLNALKTPAGGTATSRPSPLGPVPKVPIPSESTDGGFTGDLQILSLPELLEFLRNQRAHGELLVRGSDGEGRLRLHDGQIAGVQHPGRRPLGQVLVDVELITHTDLKRSVIRPEDLDRDTVVAQVLLSQRLVERDALHALMRDQIVEGVQELVGWTTGSVVFRRGAPSPEAPAVLVDTRMALLEAMRRIDEDGRDD